MINKQNIKISEYNNIHDVDYFLIAFDSTGIMLTN